jgi:uncharacterized protein (TIGR02588 family)
MARRPSARPPHAAAKSPAKPRPVAATPLLEWIAAGVGLAIVLATAGLIAAEAVRPDHSPPAVVVQNLGARRTAAGWVLEIRAANRGGGPAAQVVVEGELQRPGEAPETAEATFDFIPDHSARRGGLFFSADPSQGALTLRAKGYAEP